MSFDLLALIRNTFHIRAGEVVFVMTNPPEVSAERHAMAMRWHEALVQVAAETGAKIFPLVIYPDPEEHNAPLPKFCQVGEVRTQFAELFSESTLVLALAAHSATKPLLEATKYYPQLRAASLPGVIPAMEETALRADPEELRRRAQITSALMDEAEAAEIEFSTGHSLHIDLRRNAKRTNIAGCDDGYLPPDSQQRVINLPSGEVWRVPFEEPFGDGAKDSEPSQTRGIMPVSLQKGTILYFHIERNRIRQVEGTGTDADQFREFFAVDPARTNIAELGLGFNPYAIVRGVVLEDEKAGPHIAYGASSHLGGIVDTEAFQKEKSVAHVDVVYAKNSLIHLRKVTLTGPQSSCVVIENGDYTIF